MTLKVGADVLFRGCLSSCMPNPVEALLEVYEDMIKILLVLQIFLTEDSYVEDLLCGTPSCSEACMFFGDEHIHTHKHYSTIKNTINFISISQKRI